MTTWRAFAAAAPELATFGARRLHGHVAYLATVSQNGQPRVHPVTPIISAECLFLFMEPTSPKGKDLQRGSRYQLHCGVEDTSGGAGEFYLRGTAALVTDPALRAEAAAAGYAPKPHYILFTLNIDYAFMNIYGAGDTPPTVARWSSGTVGE